MSVIWTWPLALHLRDHIPGLPGDNFSFLWNLWWMRKALSAPELGFFHSTYLFSPFGVDLVNHPNTALQGFLSATLLSRLPIVVAENLYILVSVFLNAVCAYALAFELTRERRLAKLHRTGSEKPPPDLMAPSEPREATETTESPQAVPSEPNGQ